MKDKTGVTALTSAWRVENVFSLLKQYYVKASAFRRVITVHQDVLLSLAFRLSTCIGGVIPQRLSNARYQISCPL